MDAVQTAAVIAFLQECYEFMESGKEELISQNTDYKSSRGVLTDDYVDRMIAAIDEEFQTEMTRYPAYHFSNADGATTTPDFWRLSPTARRALVEGLDRVMDFEST